MTGERDDVAGEGLLGAGGEVVAEADESDDSRAALAEDGDEFAAGGGLHSHGRDGGDSCSGGDHGQDGGELAALEGDTGAGAGFTAVGDEIVAEAVALFERRRKGSSRRSARRMVLCFARE